jgi:hypothetical protein
MIIMAGQSGMLVDADDFSAPRRIDITGFWLVGGGGGTNKSSQTNQIFRI